MAATADGNQVGGVVGPTEGEGKDMVSVLGRAVAPHAGVADDNLRGNAPPICVPVGHER